MDHHQLVRSLAAGRVAFGAALTLLPGTAGRSWLGPVADDRSVKVMTRAMGARDMALGAGTLHALQEGSGARSWVLASAVGDVADAVGTVLALRRLGLRRGLPILVLAVGAAGVSWAAAEHLD